MPILLTKLELGCWWTDTAVSAAPGSMESTREGHLKQCQAQNTTVMASVSVELMVKLQKQTKEKNKFNKIIIKCSKYYKINPCCDIPRCEGSGFSGEVEAGFSEEVTQNEVVLCEELQGSGHLGKFRSKKGPGEFGSSQVSHTLSGKVSLVVLCLIVYEV